MSIIYEHTVHLATLALDELNDGISQYDLDFIESVLDYHRKFGHMTEKQFMYLFKILYANDELLYTISNIGNFANSLRALNENWALMYEAKIRIKKREEAERYKKEKEEEEERYKKQDQERQERKRIDDDEKNFLLKVKGVAREYLMRKFNFKDYAELRPYIVSQRRLVDSFSLRRYGLEKHDFVFRVNYKVDHQKFTVIFDKDCKNVYDGFTINRTKETEKKEVEQEGNIKESPTFEEYMANQGRVVVQYNKLKQKEITELFVAELDAMYEKEGRIPLDVETTDSSKINKCHYKKKIIDFFIKRKINNNPMTVTVRKIAQLMKAPKYSIAEHIDKLKEDGFLIASGGVEGKGPFTYTINSQKIIEDYVQNSPLEMNLEKSPNQQCLTYRIVKYFDV